MIYLACPYSHPDPLVSHARYDAANQIAVYLMRIGYVVFSPLTHSHPLATEYGLQNNWEFWAAQDLPILERCDRLFVACLPGWATSTGVKTEIEHARERDIPVHYLNAEHLPEPLQRFFYAEAC